MILSTLDERKKKNTLWLFLETTEKKWERQDGQSWNNKVQDPRKRKVIRNFRQDETTVQESHGLSKKKTQNMVWF